MAKSQAGLVSATARGPRSDLTPPRHVVASGWPAEGAKPVPARPAFSLAKLLASRRSERSEPLRLRSRAFLVAAW